MALKADRLRHGRPEEAKGKMCDCECSRFQHCPIGEDAPQKWQDCKTQYKAMLKGLKGDV